MQGRGGELRLRVAPGGAAGRPCRRVEGLIRAGRVLELNLKVESGFQQRAF